MMIKQRTLQSPVSASGIGLHSGCKVDICLYPAPPGHGIVFERSDLPGTPSIPACAEHVRDTRLSTTLVEGNTRIGTIEHLMAALAGLGIDNARISLNSVEVPLLDGSAAPFIFLMQQAGIVEQPAGKKFYKIKKKIRVVEGDKWLEIGPHHGYRISLTIGFDHPAISHSNQSITIDFAEASFVEEISRARTFGFMHEVEGMRRQGLGLGGSLENAVVLDERRVLNPEGLRFGDEFVRHKMLDAIGDLYQLGGQIIGEVKAFKSGHALNNQLIRALLADETAYQILTFETPSEAPASFHQLGTALAIA